MVFGASLNQNLLKTFELNMNHIFLNDETLYAFVPNVEDNLDNLLVFAGEKQTFFVFYD